MNVIDNAVLTAMFVSQFDGSDPVAAVRARCRLDGGYVRDRISDLISNGLADSDTTLSELGRSSLRVVLAGGVFDIIHPGHIHTLRAARNLGDVLVVVVATSGTAKKMKKRMPLHSQDQRRDLVGALSTVDLCLVGEEGDIFRTVDRVRPEVIALGYDQIHQEKFITDGCRRIGLDVKVARLQSPVPEISSSRIEQEYGDSIHGI